MIPHIKQLSNKFSEAHPLPTHLLKSCADIFSPFLTSLFNRSLSEGIFTSCWKRVCVTPVLKKSSADPQDVTSYRTISKLLTLSKLLERVVRAQLFCHVEKHSLLPDTQSAYRFHFSTESAVLKFLSDSLLSFDEGHVTVSLTFQLHSIVWTI